MKPKTRLIIYSVLTIAMSVCFAERVYHHSLVGAMWDGLCLAFLIDGIFDARNELKDQSQEE